MRYVNKLCVDVGTADCPCPLAETGDCPICGRLSGRDCSDCKWSGVCIYNEYIQNDKLVRNRRKNFRADIVEKKEYENDIVIMALKVPRGFALEASFPGSFVFVNGEKGCEFSALPISVMRTDTKTGKIYIAFKKISAKTKLLSESEGSIVLRGVYRNGLLGKGLSHMEEDVKRKIDEPAKWLIITKGIGFAPALNILKWAEGRIEAEILADDEKAEGGVVDDCFTAAGLSYKAVKLAEIISALRGKRSSYGDIEAWRFDRVFILASDYYIVSLASELEIPDEKLIFSNNFNMCCGEGICGACSCADGAGNSVKMCKCRDARLSGLLKY